MTKGQNFLGYSVEISHAIFSDENSDLAFALWAKPCGNFSQAATDVVVWLYISLKHVKH